MCPSTAPPAAATPYNLIATSACTTHGEEERGGWSDLKRKRATYYLFGAFDTSVIPQCRMSMFLIQRNTRVNPIESFGARSVFSFREPPMLASSGWLGGALREGRVGVFAHLLVHAVLLLRRAVLGGVVHLRRTGSARRGKRFHHKRTRIAQHRPSRLGASRRRGPAEGQITLTSPRYTVGIRCSLPCPKGPTDWLL
jgi:hypothetical protein